MDADVDVGAGLSVQAGFQVDELLVLIPLQRYDIEGGDGTKAIAVPRQFLPEMGKELG